MCAHGPRAGAGAPCGARGTACMCPATRRCILAILLYPSSSGLGRVSCCWLSLQDPLSMHAQLAIGRDIAVQRRTRDTPQFLAELTDFDVPVLHGSLGEADLRLRQAKGPAPWRPRARAACKPAMRAFRISSRSNSANAAKIPKTSLPLAVVVSMVAPWPVQDFQPDAALRERLGGIDQMLEVASQAVELPDDKCIAVPQRLQTGGEGRAVLVVPGGFVFIDVLVTDTGVEERVALQIQNLAAVRFRDAGISNEHGCVSQTIVLCNGPEEEPRVP